MGLRLRPAYRSAWRTARFQESAIVTWLAVDRGLFAKNNLDVELIYVAGSQAMQSLLSGTTPIGIQGIEPVFRVNAHGSDTVMILGIGDQAALFDHRAPRDQETTASSRASPWASLATVRRRICFSACHWKSGDSSPRLTCRFYKWAGCRRSWPEWNRERSSAGHFRCLLWRRAKREGYRELADVADLVPDYQVAGVVTRRTFIKQNTEVVRGFVKAIAEAMATIQKRS